jgi:hypothetical protein
LATFPVSASDSQVQLIQPFVFLLLLLDVSTASPEPGGLSFWASVRYYRKMGISAPSSRGRQQVIHAERDRKLEEARKRRQIRRQRTA